MKRVAENGKDGRGDGAGVDVEAVKRREEKRREERRREEKRGEDHKMEDDDQNSRIAWRNPDRCC